MAAHKRVEKVYLNRAKQNIEKYRKRDARVLFTDASGKPVSGISVSVDQTTQDFLFGNLIEDSFNKELTDSERIKFRKMFTDLFNFTELIVKWTGYEYEQGKPQWQKFQEKLDWCKLNNITPKGHNLGWTNMSGTPPWLLKLPYDKATELYKARIYNMVGGFKKQVNMWDVVNEPVTTIPWQNALRDTAFGDSKIAEGYRYDVKGITVADIVPWVENSYKWAYEADPKGDFILNEFYLIAKPAVRERFYQLVKTLKEHGAPVSGIGIQAHEPRDMWFSPVEVINTFNKYRDLNLPLHITEFIPQSSGKKITGGWRTGTWTEEAQAEFAEQFYILAYGDPSLASIHWWGLSDRFIWLPGGGLLDKDFNPKPVYTRLKKLIKTDWMTHYSHRLSDKDGAINFRGFFGDYNVTAVTADGKRKTFKIHLGKDNDTHFTLNL